jgi:hypothetical protein
MANLKMMDEATLLARIDDAAKDAEAQVEEVRAVAMKDVREALRALRDLPPGAEALVARATVALAEEFEVRVRERGKAAAGKLELSDVKMDVPGHCNDYECRHFDMLRERVRIAEGRYRAVFFLVPLDDKGGTPRQAGSSRTPTRSPRS